MLHSFLYRKGKPLETNLSRAQMLAVLQEKDVLLWVDLEEPSDFESETLVEIFNFHDLAVEDCVNDQSQPKVDDYEEYLFMVMHAVRLMCDEEKKVQTLLSDELDIFLSKNYVVTFHKVPIKSVQQIREITHKKPEAIMGHGPDMLVHSILDRLVDSYQPVIDEYDDAINRIEDEIFIDRQSKEDLSGIMQIKRDLFNLRRVVAPQRDTINFLTRNPTAFIKTRNMIYFRDIYDHLFRIYGSVEGFHEMITGILQAYFSYSSHLLNRTIQRMTVMATLSMPAIMIASIYGMNFKHMPELAWQFGYPFSFALMAGTSLILLIWMKIKKWI